MLNAFIAAWNLCVRFPLPAGDRTGRPEPEMRHVLYCLTGVGLLLGAALWLTARLLLYLVPEPAVGAAVAAIAIPPLYWWILRGRQVRALIEVADNWPASVPAAAAKADTSWTPAITMHVAVLLHALGVGLIVAGGIPLWLGVIPLLSFTVFAEAAGSENGENGLSERPYHWLVAALAVLLVAGALDRLIAGLFAIVLAWLFAPLAMRTVAKRTGVPPETQRWAAVAIIELVVLWVGVLAL